MREEERVMPYGICFCVRALHRSHETHFAEHGSFPGLFCGAGSLSEHCSSAVQALFPSRALMNI